MRLRDLIDELEDLAEQWGDDSDVRLAIQPRYPFEHTIEQVVASCDGDDDGPTGPTVIYIAEGSQRGYLPGHASNALGWRQS